MASGFSKNPKTKKDKAAGKLAFAKDKNQAVLAIVVVCLFVATTIYNISKALIPQNPVSAPASSQQNADKIAQQQQQDLQSMNNPGQNNSTPDQDIAKDANDIFAKTSDMQGPGSNVPSEAQSNNNQAASADDIEIIAKKRSLLKANGKMVLVTVADSVTSNPFLPSSDVTKSAFSYLTPPPETLPSDSEASKVMKTVVSGILYDKYSPSAILNIEGNDYLVKRGDIINNYEVLSISKNQVTVRLGKNVYSAGVGELLSPTDLNYNVVANLNKRFGGNNVSIRVKKKGY